MNDYSIADLAAVTGAKGNGDGFGDGNGAWWLLVLFALLGGFGNNGYGGGYRNGGQAMPSGDVLYPWMNQSQQVSDGLAALSSQVCNGFAGVEAGANARQMADTQQAFAAQTAMMQGFNGVQSQLADCCCENRLATANQTATILAENCADRAAISDGIRDVIEAQTAGTQRILDKLCDQELYAERRENDNLRQQLNMQTLAASQAAQNTFIQQGFANEVDQLYNRLNTCPVPSMPVYGRTPIFTCQSQNGCGCGM